MSSWNRDVDDTSLRYKVILLTFIKGRIYQCLDHNYKAQYEFRAVLKLAKGYQPAIIELIKSLTGQGEVFESKNLLEGLIRRRYPGLI
jgi:hypothetical protein